MSSDLVNIDFEPELFGLEGQTSFSAEFEYIYFFFNEKNLKNLREYPEDYLEFLKSLGLKLPKLSPNDQNPKNWWGEISDISRMLNSKITATKIGKENGLCPEGVEIVESIEEIEKTLKNNPDKDYFLRDPYLAAGNNSTIISLKNFRKKFVSKLIKEKKLIMAPYFRRLMDVGLIFKDGELELLWNLNSKDGKFKAGIVYKDENDFLSLIEKKFGLKNHEILGIQKKIYHLYQEIGAKGIVQIDSFFYLELGEIKYYPLVEVNYRKSFGLFINRLRPFIKDGGVGIFLNFNTSDLLPIKNFKERLNQIGDLSVIPLSPQDGRFSSFFATSDSLENLKTLVEEFWKKISITDAVLSPSIKFDQFTS